MEELEPRLLLSADLFPFADLPFLRTPFESASDTPHVQMFDASGEAALEGTGQFPPDVAHAPSPFGTGVDVVGALAPAPYGSSEHDEHPTTAANQSEEDDSERHELVFVDPNTPDYQKLVAHLKAGRQAGTHIEIVVLDADRDGIEQITEALGSYQGLDAVHVVSHGTDGRLELGGGELDIDSVETHKRAILSWRDALSDRADLLLYGCDLAGGAEGRALIDALANVTDADVAASTDATGHALHGGDWDLEYRIGETETPVALSAGARDDWQGILAAESVGDDFESGGYTGSTGTQPWTGGWTEIGDDGTSGGGQIQIVSDAEVPSGTGLRLGAQGNPPAFNEIRRGADLSNAVNASLTFDYRRHSSLGYSAESPARLEVSSDGGTSWTVLQSFTDGFDPTVQNASFDISAYASPDTMIRFRQVSSWVDGFIYFDNIKISYSPAPDSLWVTTDGDVVGGGQSGTSTWQSGDALRVGDPNFSLGAGTTDGTVSVAFDMENFASGASTTALHYVSSDIQVGASGFQLRAGDLLLASGTGATLSSASSPSGAFTNNLTVTSSDVFVFRPDTAGDYSAGTFAKLLEAPMSTTDIRGVSLIERNTLVGDTNVQAGDFFLLTGPPNQKDVILYETTDVGAGNTSGTGWLFIKGTDVSLTDLTGIELVEQSVDVGGKTLDTGTLLLSTAAASSVGDNALAVQPQDVFALNVTSTSFGSPSSAATASMVFDGSGVAFDTAAEGLAGVTLAPTDNTAPALNPVSPSLTSVTEDDISNAGDFVLDIVGGSVSDADGDPAGMAITGTVNGNGTWEYSTDGGTTWAAVGLVAQDDALLLRETDKVRFVPDGENADSASITYRAWDQSAGTAGDRADTTTNGGSTSFSTATDTASVTVTAVNDAPALDNAGAMTLTDVNEDDANPAGDSVSAIIASAGGDRITDVDAGAVEGIAVIGVDDTNGTWQYDAGSGWTDFGAVSDTSAVLLDTAALVRFVPNADYNGPAGNLTFRAWDQTSGASGDTAVDVSTNGAATAFSTATETATLDVIVVNDAPTAADNTVTTAEDTPYAFAAADFGFSDVDAGDTLQSVTITTLPAAGLLELSGVAVTAGQVIAVADITAGNLTFTPVPDANGAGYASFDFTVSDGTASSSPANTLTVDVTAVNDAPVNNTPGAQSTDKDTPLVFSAAGGNAISVSDVDVGGSSVEVTLTATDGTLTLAGTAGLTFSAGTGNGDVTMTFTGAVADVNAALEGLVFEPILGFTGTATLTIATDDQGNVGAGGALTDTDSVAITVDSVNDPPVITSNATPAVPENTTTVITVTSTDIDGGTPVYSITGGIDATRFSIDGATGELRFNTAPNFEAPVDADTDNVYQVQVTVDDGNGGTDVQDLSVTVTPVNEAPILDQNAGLTLSEGGNAVMADSALHATDEDNTPNEITFQVTAGPSYGRLELTTAPGTAITSFTQEDIDTNRVVYVHDDSNTTADSFTFTFGDGASGPQGPATFTITVIPVDDDAPSLAVNTGSTTSGGTADTITSTELRYDDAQLPANVTYTITGGLADGHLELASAPGVSLTSFSQADIDAGEVVYVRDNPDSTSDGFDFSVDDGQGNVLTGQSFAVTVSSTSDASSDDTGIGPLVIPDAGATDESPPEVNEPEPSNTGGGDGDADGGDADAGADGSGSSSPQGAPQPSSGGGLPPAAGDVGTAGSGGAGSVHRSHQRVAERILAAYHGSAADLEVPGLAEALAASRGVASLPAQKDFTDSLDRVREYVRHTARVETTVVGSTVAVATGLSVGYVLWLVRGGLLFASLLSSMPAWRVIDPLPVLTRFRGRAEGDDDESLDSLVSRRSHSPPPKEPLEDRDEPGGETPETGGAAIDSA